MPTPKKQPVTIASLQSQLASEKKKYENLEKFSMQQFEEIRQSKRAFEMLKENYEKNKLLLERSVSSVLNMSSHLK